MVFTVVSLYGAACFVFRVLSGLVMADFLVIILIHINKILTGHECCLCDFVRLVFYNNLFLLDYHMIGLIS